MSIQSTNIFCLHATGTVDLRNGGESYSEQLRCLHQRRRAGREACVWPPCSPNIVSPWLDDYLYFHHAAVSNCEARSLDLPWKTATRPGLLPRLNVTGGRKVRRCAAQRPPKNGASAKKHKDTKRRGKWRAFLHDSLDDVRRGHWARGSLTKPKLMVTRSPLVYQRKDI